MQYIFKFWFWFYGYVHEIESKNKVQSTVNFVSVLTCDHSCFVQMSLAFET